MPGRVPSSEPDWYESLTDASSCVGYGCTETLAAGEWLKKRGMASRACATEARAEASTSSRVEKWLRGSDRRRATMSGSAVTPSASLAMACASATLCFTRAWPRRKVSSGDRSRVVQRRNRAR